MKRSVFTVAVAVMGLSFTAAKYLITDVMSSGNSYSSQFADISNMEFDIKAANVIFITDKNAQGVRVDVNDAPKELEVKGDGGTLKIEEHSKKDTFGFFGRSTPKKYNTEIYITVPENAVFDDININVSSGFLKRLGGISAESIELSVGSGSVVLDEMTVKEDVKFDISSGSFTINNSTVGDCLCGEIGSGSVTADGVSVSGDMQVDLNSGNFTGSNISINGDSALDIGSGNVDLNRFAPGGDTNIEVSSGNTAIDLEGSQADYSINARTSSGKVSVNDSTGREYSSGSGDKHIEVQGGSGNISIIV